MPDPNPVVIVLLRYLPILEIVVCPKLLTIGLAFSNIDKLKSFEGAGFTAEMREQIKAVVEKETEQDSEFIELVKTDSTIDTEPNENKILEALSNQKYTWRALHGISTESNVNKNEVKAIVNNLVKKGYVNGLKGG